MREMPRLQMSERMEYSAPWSRSGWRGVYVCVCVCVCGVSKLAKSNGAVPSTPRLK